MKSRESNKVESSEVRNIVGTDKPEGLSDHSKTLAVTVCYMKSYLRIFSRGVSGVGFHLNSIILASEFKKYTQNDEKRCV